MNRSPDDDRLPADPWLREALRHAPGADVPVPEAVRNAILDHARRAAAPVKAQRQRSWRDALWQLLTPTRMGWAGAVATVVLILVVTGVQRESAPLEPSLAQRPSNGPAPVPTATADAALAVASRPRVESARSSAPATGTEGTTLALATPPLTANSKVTAEAPAPAAPRAGLLQAPSRATATAVAADPTPTTAGADATRAPQVMPARSEMAAPASAAPGRPEASPPEVSVAVAPQARPAAPLSVAAAPPAPAPAAAGTQVPAQGPAAPPAAAAAAEAASDGASPAARASTYARSAPKAAAPPGSQPPLASTLADAGSPRPAATGLLPARTVSADRLGEVLQWARDREGLRWSADGREGAWGPAQEVWLSALRAAASGRWAEVPVAPGAVGTVVLQVPGQPVVRLTVGDAPWAVWVHVEGAAPLAARLDSRARARIEALRQGW